MSISQALYIRLITPVGPLVAVPHISHLDNWIWMVVGILQSNSLALNQSALHIPTPACAESRVTTLRRWLQGRDVEVWTLYRPVLETVLTDWRAVAAPASLDGVEVFGGRLQIFRLSLQPGCRAIPLVWTIIPGQGVTQMDKLETMLTHAAQFLQPRVTSVRFLADRGFRDCGWARLCLKLGWNYAIWVANNTLVDTHHQPVCPINKLSVGSGQHRYFQNVHLTEEAKFMTNLPVTWTTGDNQHAPDLLAVISNQIAGRQRL